MTKPCEPGRNLVGLLPRNSKWYWGSALVLLLVASVLVLVQNSMRYLEEPTVLVKLSSLQVSFPFPAVVVCPEIRFPQHRIDAFMDEIKCPPGANKTDIRDNLPQLAAFFAADVPYRTRELGALRAVLDYNGRRLEDTARRLTTSCEETLLQCRWLGEPVACIDLFRMEVTGDGFCCVFNGRSLRREISGERAHHATMEAPYVHENDVGPLNGLVVVINQTQKHDDIDLSYKWVSLQEPQSYVDISMNGTALSPGVEHWLGYSTFGIRVRDSGLQSLSQDLRHCRMHHDEPLQLFPVYTRNYCRLECEVFHTWHSCGCVALTHPRPAGVRHCRAQDLACARHAKATEVAPVMTYGAETWTLTAVGWSHLPKNRYLTTNWHTQCRTPTGPLDKAYCRWWLDELLTFASHRVSFQASFCDCPETCDLSMSVVRLLSFALTPNTSSYDPIYKRAHFDQRSVIRVYINGYERKTFEQKPVFSKWDLYSQFGGIFNIYFGCSILSLLEITIIIIRFLIQKYRQFHKQKPNKESDIGKFGGNSIKAPLRRSIHTDGIPITFNKAISKLAYKKSLLKKKTKVVRFIK